MRKPKKQYNRYRKRSQAQTNRSNPFTWLLCGIILGLIIPGILYFKAHSTHAPINEATEEEPLLLEHEGKPKDTRQLSLKKPKNKPAATAKVVPCSKKYEFYNLLSDQNDPVRRESETTQEQVPLPQKFILEIGSFSNYAEADELKAQLLLMGMDHVSIRKKLDEAASIYRVIIGPFTTKAKANDIQNKLKKNAVKSQLTSIPGERE